MADLIMTIIILGGYIVLQNFIPWMLALLISLFLGVFAHDIYFIARLKWNNRKYNKGE